MSASSLLKSNPMSLALSNPRLQNFHVHRCCIKPAEFVVGTRFPSVNFQNFQSSSLKEKSFLSFSRKAEIFSNSGVNVQSFVKSTSSSTDIEAQFTRSSISKGNPSITVAIKSILKVTKCLKISAVEALLLLMMMMCGRDRALALADGVRAGNSYSSSLKSCTDLYSSITSAWQNKLFSSLKTTYFHKIEPLLPLLYYLLGCLFIFASIAYYESRRGTEIRVIKLQVGLYTYGGSLHDKFNSFSRRSAAAYSVSRGFKILLRDIAKHLAYSSDSYTAVYSSVKKCKNREDAEECFKKLSDEERDKLDVERLVDISNVKYISTASNKDLAKRTYVLVTILVAAKGKAVDSFSPHIDCSYCTREAAKTLEEIADTDKIQALDVLWCDTPCGEELHEEYPHLLKLGEYY